MGNKFSHYIWLFDTILHNKRISLKEIEQKWKLSPHYDGKSFSRSTFNRWKECAESIFEINIKCEEGGEYRYYIEDDSRINKANDLRIWLLDHFHISSILNSNIPIRNKILTENIPSARNFLSEITQALKQKQTISFVYEKFISAEEKENIIGLPLCLKQYKQRWYVLLQKQTQTLRIYALDRMSKLTILPEVKIKSTLSNHAISNYWEHSYGIYTHPDKPAERVVLKVSEKYSKYLRSLPLHHSQQEIESHAAYSLFSYQLCIERDFIQELLSNGTDIEVLEPLHLRQTMANSIRDMLQMYEQK